MDTLDGTLLHDMKKWRCSKNKDHVLGVIERKQVKMEVEGRAFQYFTSRLIIFRHAIDLNAEIPAEIDVAGDLDGKILSMVWRCSVQGCGCLKEWHPDDMVVGYLVETYLSE